MKTLLISTQGTPHLVLQSGPYFPRGLVLVIYIILVLGVMLSPPLTYTMLPILRHFSPLLVNLVSTIVVSVGVVVIKIFNVRVFRTF